MPSNYFLFLNNKQLTLPADRDFYQRITRNTYKQEGFQFTYLLLLCKLYDMANLPATSAKAFFYGGFVVLFSTYSFYRASQKHVEVLTELDSKYEPQYHRYMEEQKQEKLALKEKEEQRRRIQAQQEELLAKQSERDD